MKQKRSSDLSRELVEIHRELDLGAAIGGPELALFVIWDKARQLESEILTSIGATFEIRGVHEISWDAERVDENFARFYQGRPIAPYGTFFSDQKGRGPFLLVTVIDAAPCYEARETHRGTEVLNSRCFDLKHRIRREVGGVMRVHSTDTAAEAERDLLLLLGATASEYLAAHPEPWDGTVRKLHRNLSGANGWTGLDQLLNHLNHGVRYVVLRAGDTLADAVPSQLSILTDNYHEAIRLLNARPAHRGLPTWGGRFICSVAQAPLAVDLRFVGDNYYDSRFAAAMLRRRRLLSGGYFAPTAEDEFEALAWHTVLRSPRPDPSAWQQVLRQASDDGSSPPAENPYATTPTVSSWPALLRQGAIPRPPRDPLAYHDYRAAGCRLAGLRARTAALRRTGWAWWLPATHSVRSAIVSTKQSMARMMPAVRMLWPSYRRLAHGPAHNEVTVET